MIPTLVATALAAIASLFGIGERVQDRAPARTVVWALGDGADGSAEGLRLARYVRSQRPDRFIYLGDVYERGTRAEFRANYHAAYGRLARRTDPVLGNHEFKRRFDGYYRYWEGRRGFDRERARHRAYVDDTGWQLIAYSSETKPWLEAEWLRAQIGSYPGTCRIAAGHRGRHAVADDKHADNPELEPLWAALAGRTAVNLVAHSHLYGRLAPIDGVHVIVSGAGGHALRGPGEQARAVSAVQSDVPTATRLELRRGSLDFSQIDATGRVYDSGTIGCVPAW